jgi:hypothetical protein
MHRYIEKFVLCPNCGLPETEYKIKSDCIYHKCAACGAKEMVDMSHKLCNYILAENKKAKKEKGSDKKVCICCMLFRCLMWLDVGGGVSLHKFVMFVYLLSRSLCYQLCIHSNQI